MSFPTYSQQRRGVAEKPKALVRIKIRGTDAVNSVTLGLYNISLKLTA